MDEIPNRAITHLHAPLRQQPRLQIAQRQVRLGRKTGAHEVPVVSKKLPLVPADPAQRNAARPTIAL